MKPEGQVRIPSGCAIAAVISKDGKRMTGRKIIDAMKPMHDRSNGLGGGFAAYGIYPEYKDFYALHMFYDERATRKNCEAFLKERFEIVKSEIIPTRKIPAITDEPIIWRYFVAPLRSQLSAYQLDEKEFVARTVMKINTELGYVPVPFSELTDDEAFWKGCEGCVNHDVLMRTERRYCICTAMLYDPAKHGKK